MRVPPHVRVPSGVPWRGPLLKQPHSGGCIGMGGGTPPPPRSRAPSPCPATVSVTATASPNGICNRQ